MKMIKCDSCGKTQSLNAQDKTLYHYYRIVLQDIYAGEVLESGIDDDTSYHYDVLDLCPDCIRKVGSALHQDAFVEHFLDRCKTPKM